MSLTYTRRTRLVANAIVSPTTSNSAKRSAAAALTDGLSRAAEGSRHRLARRRVRRRRMGARLRSASHQPSLLAPSESAGSPADSPSFIE
jgi:hypothetical protein